MHWDSNQDDEGREEDEEEEEEEEPVVHKRVYHFGVWEVWCPTTQHPGLAASSHHVASQKMSSFVFVFARLRAMSARDEQRQIMRAPAHLNFENQNLDFENRDACPRHQTGRLPGMYLDCLELPRNGGKK